MKVAVIGAGVLGLTLAYRLARMGHAVELVEGAPQVGGLACAEDYGSFTWDRFYHCILPQDANLLGLLGELGLTDELRWSVTGTGYYAHKRFHAMNGSADFLRFPLLSVLDKARLGAAIVYATRFADPYALYKVTAEEWLTRICGRNTYRVFWRPLLRAKFGPYHDQVAAVFIWATLTRLFGARAGASRKENLGYVHGGYARILGRMVEALTAAGAKIHLAAPVRAIRPAAAARGGHGGGCEVVYADAAGGGAEGETAAVFDQVFFTAPTGAAAKVVAPELRAHVERTGRAYPTSGAYLGVICLTLVLERPLTPYYVLNIGDESVELTGLIEMTNLIAPRDETGGRSLVYLPRYLDSADGAFEEPDEAVRRATLDRGLKRIFPGFRESEIVHAVVNRARYVQPLPLVRHGEAEVLGLPALERPFQVVNTSMLRCATLNNNEAVGLAEAFLRQNAAALAAG